MVIERSRFAGGDQVAGAVAELRRLGFGADEVSHAQVACPELWVRGAVVISVYGFTRRERAAIVRGVAGWTLEDCRRAAVRWAREQGWQGEELPAGAPGDALLDPLAMAVGGELGEVPWVIERRHQPRGSRGPWTESIRVPVPVALHQVAAAIGEWPDLELPHEEALRLERRILERRRARGY